MLVIAGIMAFGQAAFATSAVLSTSPVSATNTVGVPFNVTVQVDPANNKVCVVKGTINVSNLNCQNIILASGVMAQTAPTCAAPNFTIGIPKCATTPANLFTVSVTGAQVGTSTLTLTNVKVIGAGSDVPNIIQNGAYNIISTIQSGGSHRIATTSVIVPVVNKPSITISNGGNAVVTTNATNTSTSTEVATSTDKSFLSGLSASILDAFKLAAKFIKGNIILILSLIILLLLISNVYLWKKMNKIQDQD